MQTPIAIEFYNRVKPLTTKYSPELLDGVYLFDIFADNDVIELLKQALLQIYKGTYYVPYENYHEKFSKEGNIFIAYMENGFPVVASCLLWHDQDAAIMEIGQAYSLPHKADIGFMDLADQFMILADYSRDLPIQFMSTCRKSATDQLSDQFGMKLTAVFYCPALRVDYERILTYDKEVPEPFKGEWYSILYQILNYHFLQYEARANASMKVSTELLDHPLLKGYWTLYEHQTAPHEFKVLTVEPIKIDFYFDESNNQVILEMWPICHPDFPKKLQEVEASLKSDEKSKETVLGVLGPYFYHQEENIFIPGVIFGKGTVYPYHFSVKNEIHQALGNEFEKLPPQIQSLVEDAFMGINVTESTRQFYKDHPDIFSNFHLDIRKFRGMTFSEKSKLMKLINEYPEKTTEEKLLKNLQKIIQNK